MSIRRNFDGSVEYTWPTGLSDLTLNGRSIAACQPIEARIAADGWGYVVCLTDPITGVTKKQIDGQRRTYSRWGWLAAVP